MDPAQLASEACKRFTALHSSNGNTNNHHDAILNDAGLNSVGLNSVGRGGVGAVNTATQVDPRDPGAEALLEAFRHLGTLDGWAKIAMSRLTVDPQDARAILDLRRSLEQAARLHPHFTRRLADLVADRPGVKTSRSNTGSIPLQPQAGRPAVERRA